MRALVVDGFGPDAPVRGADVPAALPGPQQVRVRMQYAGVNPADHKCRSGWMLSFPQFQPTLPFVLGFDGVGIVDAIAADVAVPGLVPGQRVCVRANQVAGQHGTFAEYVCVAATDVAPIPAALPGPAAATIGVAGVTAYQALHKFARVRAGQRVLVNGGSGGTGSYAIGLAARLGAHVAATCGPDNLDYVRALGCEHVVDYRNEDVCESVLRWIPGGVDVVLDTVNIEPLAGIERMLRPGGSVVGIATLGVESYRPADLAAHGCGYVEATARRDEAAADMAVLAGLLAADEIRSPQITVVPFDKGADALDAVGAGHVRGKLVLAIDTTEGPEL